MTPTVLTIINIAMGVVMALALFILNSFSGRLKEVEKWKVNKGEITGLKETLDERFRGIDQRIHDISQYNSLDHKRLETRFVAVQTNIEEIKKCLNLIAQGKDC